MSADAALDRFVVGTGRCGSTLLTKMLSTHRDLLGLNEVFTGLDWGRRFSTGPVSGAEVAEILATANDVVVMVTARGHEAEEVTYPFGGDSRYDRGDALPWILTSTLGHLSQDPDSHWDELEMWLGRRPAAPIASHYRALFAHLAAQAGAGSWLERSGSSIDYVGDLLACFAAAPAPDGARHGRRVVHIHRDGAEVALSMRNHAFYRLAVQLYYGVIPEGVDPQDEDAVVDAWLDGDPALELYGRYWSEQLMRGVPALAEMARGELMTLRFEDLVADPTTHMRRVAAFLELEEDPGFPARAAALVRGIPPTRIDGLDDARRELLSSACTDGRRALAELGHPDGA